MSIGLLSDASEYALRAVVWLARHSDSPQTTEAIAQGTRATYGHLARVLQVLGREGSVRGKRGVLGGYVLDVDPATLSVLDVIDVVDPVRRITECPLGLAEHSEHLCALHACIDAAISQLRETFAGMTIAEIVHGTPNRSPLCDLTSSISSQHR